MTGDNSNVGSFAYGACLATLISLPIILVVAFYAPGLLLLGFLGVIISVLYIEHHYPEEDQ